MVSRPPSRADAPLTDADIATLQSLLLALPPPLEALDVSALDGFLCGVLLQPDTVPASAWMPRVLDVEGRAPPAGLDVAPLRRLVLRRHAELERALAQRQWFDPWIFETDDDSEVAAAVLPWIAGFATAMECFPALARIDDPELIEPLATLYLHLDPEDLEDADALLQVIDTLEPPADLAEAVQDIVRSLMLIADVSRPRRRAATSPRGPAPRRRR